MKQKKIVEFIVLEGDKKMAEALINILKYNTIKKILCMIDGQNPSIPC
jgi:hypothetical protein